METANEKKVLIVGSDKESELTKRAIDALKDREVFEEKAKTIRDPMAGYKMPNLMLATALMAAEVGMSGMMEREVKKLYPDRPVKKCLNCGGNHDHNNAFCSAGCCKEWQEKRRQKQP